MDGDAMSEGLIDSFNKWRDKRARKKAVYVAIASRNPETTDAALARLNRDELSKEDPANMLQSAIDEQNLHVFSSVLAFIGDPNVAISINVGSSRYPDMKDFPLLSYAITQARTHDIALALASDRRTAVSDDIMQAAKEHGMQDVAAVLAGRVADLRRQQADRLDHEATELDKAAAQGPVAATPAPEAKPANGNEDTWALMSPTSVAHVTSSPVIGRKLTEIFNFDNKERVIISENLKTGTESTAPAEKFENLSADTVRRAEEKLKALNAEAAGVKRTFSL
jgi:hypothetical protein